MLDPRCRSPVVDAWDGLTRIIGKTSAAMVRRADEDAVLSPLEVSVPGLVRDDETRRPLPAIFSTAQAEWLRKLDTIQAPPSRRLIEFLEDCGDLGVSWSLNKVLLARMRVGGATVEFLAVEPDGRVHVPWSIGGRKEEFRAFAETLAAGIQGAAGPRDTQAVESSSLRERGRLGCCSCSTRRELFVQLLRPCTPR